MGKIHSCPPEPHSVRDEQGSEFGEAIAHKQCLDDSIARVQGGESAKDHGRRPKIRRVQVNAEEHVNAR